jgi:hypothetical protein
MDFQIGEVLQLKKPHPCGSSQWQVTRLGADIGLKCSGCGRFIMVPRATLIRRVKGRQPDDRNAD